MKRIIQCVVCALLFSQLLNAQYTDYIGGGHSTGITTTTSSGTNGNKTIDGEGLTAKKIAAARFLSQAGFGGNMTDIDVINNVGYEQWIDDQVAIPASDYLTELEDIWTIIFDAQVAYGVPADDIFGPYHPHFSYTWFEHLMTEDDQFRQKISYVLSQIFVISINSDLRDWAYALASYYDVLQTNGLGNYKDLLTDVSLHPAMGYYLSHFENPKTDAPNNVHPDENYAREIMQLFSIGLYELNLDGSYILDSQGDPIPTYNNDDIKELAKVFTGLGAGGIQDWVDWTGGVPVWNLGIYATDRTVPMAMYDAEHEPGAKVLFDESYNFPNGHTIPAGQTGMEDIEEAIDVIFNHPNVGPFMAKRIIQRMVKSNPTPAYIERAATVFNNNGSGVRGDMLAFIKAILLDPEARNCDALELNNPGRMREPIMRLTSLLKALPLTNVGGNFWEAGVQFNNDMSQQVLASPTVFNYYLPNYEPNGDIGDAGLVAPEFQIFNTQTSIGYINQVHNWTIWDYILYDWEDNEIFGENGVNLENAYLENTITNDGIEKFLNEIDITIGLGQISDDTRDLIRQAAMDLNWEPVHDALLMLYILMISPDYTILR